MSVLIKNGTIVTSEGEFQGDIYVEGESIKAIGKDVEYQADETVDATGKYILPGGVDQHVHFSFTYKGSKVRGFETSNAAAVGGTTTVIEFVNQEQGKGLVESIDEYRKKEAEGIAMVDYSFHSVMTDPRPEVIEEIPRLAEAGYPTMKLFMAYKGMFFHADDDAILQALYKGKEAGVTIMVHAENADMIDVLTKKLIAEGKTAPYFHAVSRPPVVEAEATRRAIYLAELADAPLYVVHVSAKELGFSEICENTMDAVSDRDFAIEFVSCCAMTMMHLSRLCEELILWNSTEFSFIEMDDAFSTGSSIMTQKKNPDMAELIRGKTGRVYGDLFALLTIMKGLPLAYNKDMQEDKPPLFDAGDTLKDCLSILTQVISTMEIKTQNMEKAANSGFMNATDAADYLVKKSLPFRDCHEIIGKMVLYCIKENKNLDDLTLEEFKNFSPLFEADIYDAIDIKKRALKIK